jgi:uncharacterized protein
MKPLLAAVTVLGAVIAIMAGGCASPPSHFYTLSGTLGPAQPAFPQAHRLSVAVGPVAIPAEVDRPEIVVSEGANRVRLDETNRWAAPLEDNIARVVADNLVTLLGTPRITLFPQTAGEDAAYRVLIDVQGFRSTPGDAASLEAVWTVRRTQDNRSETGRTSLREPVSDTGYEALAAAHSRALAALSRDIAAGLEALSRAPAKAP